MQAITLRMGSPIGARMLINNREVDYFCGTSYYALHGHPLVIQAAREAVMAFGLGPATSASVPPIELVQTLAKRFFNSRSATYVISGYLGAMVLAQALEPDYDLALIDECSHYSVFDGFTGSGKRVVRFRHLDPEDLSAKLKEHTRPGEAPLVMTDGVFPITGAIAPLPKYAEVLRGYPEATLCTDDAHAIGVIGDHGRGTFEYYGMAGERFHLTGTLSKACGGIGGIIPGGPLLAGQIANNSRIPRGASAPPVPAAAASAMGLRLLMDHPEMREDLRDNVRLVRQGFRSMGFQLAATPIPIVNIVGAPDMNLKHVEEELFRNDIAVLYVPPRGYSDAPDVESLRIAVFSTHTGAQIERLLDTCRRAL